MYIILAILISFKSNKIGVYIMRQIKKLTWLQACILEDMRVICCNSLSDSHFQTYVIKFIEIMIDYYLLITSHVSHAFTSCTRYTSYSLLNFVHDIVCNLVVAIQNYIFYGVWCKICLRVGKNCVFDDSKPCFWRSRLNSSVFENF